jgi:hypothetical protein
MTTTKTTAALAVTPNKARTFTRAPKPSEVAANLDRHEANIESPDGPGSSAAAQAAFILSDVAEAAKIKPEAKGAPQPASELDVSTVATEEGATLSALWTRMNNVVNWQEVGTLLGAGKLACGPDNNAFGRWAKLHAPGLEGNARTDAMWLVSDEFAQWLALTGAKVPKAKTHPTTIRRWFKAEAKRLGTGPVDESTGEGDEGAEVAQDGPEAAGKTPAELIGELARRLLKSGFSDGDEAARLLAEAMKAAETK